MKNIASLAGSTYDEYIIEHRLLLLKMNYGIYAKLEKETSKHIQLIVWQDINHFEQLPNKNISALLRNVLKDVETKKTIQTEIKDILVYLRD
ncbi:hypothetical protein MY04_4105 [Flammeovirga sp. MY04]|uniref:hypothetical protein n=1 Tax=Flammeovirga sp. MY04 TaxID=1191459 RepID=UPI0008062373|nr:hypothetical protein [Flammeovirga sp. MY04]ANQ51449.1 hypothetical protein MY04_4105 [Flammeovirga sp. MY04]